jgi:hypothetical protein
MAIAVYDLTTLDWRVAKLGVEGSGGVPTQITVADESADTTCFPMFAPDATGDIAPKTGSNLTFNSSSGLLTATSFNGALTGDVTGNADSATALQTARTIGGTSFDGTANIVPSLITTADESADTTCFPLFAISATGDVQPKTGSNLTFNSSSGLLTATQLAGTIQTASQTNITSLGTLTDLDVDNININLNTISSTAGTDLNINPLAGQQVVIDGGATFDGGVVNNITTLTSTNIVVSTKLSGAGYVQQASITIPDPDTSEKWAVLTVNKDITITEIHAFVTDGTTPSVTWSLRYDTDWSNAGTLIDTNTTTTDTIQEITAITDATVEGTASSKMIWLETSASSGSPTSLHVTIYYTTD